MEPVKRSRKSLMTLAIISLITTAWLGVYISSAYNMAMNEGYSGGQAVSATINNFVAAVKSEPNPVKAWNPRSPGVVGFILALWTLFALYLAANKRKFIAGKEHGTARWGVKKDIKDLVDKKDIWANMPLTQTESISIYNYKVNRNTLIIGGSGSGKTRGFVMPNILQAHSSYVITDPKGEILEKSGYFFEKMGYEVRVLNLDEKEKSDYYNPFAYIFPERPGYEERVLDLVETVIINTDGGEKRKSSDPFWEKAERLFLTSLFFFVADGFVPDERNMSSVLYLIRQLELEEEQDNRDSNLDIFVELFAEEHGADHIGVQLYNEFRGKSAGKTAKSIVISAVARLGAPFQTKEMKRILVRDTMNLEQVGEKKMAIFIVVPPTSDTFNFIAGCLLQNLFACCQYIARVKYKDKGQMPVQVRFILDEFANTCKIPKFIELLAYARSFGVGITVILQSLEQIKKMYEKDWGVIVDNCASLLYLGRVAHEDTLKYISTLLGKGTFDKRTYGRSLGMQGSSSTNYDVIGRELMLPDEIRQIKDRDCILIISGRPPFYSRKYDYTKHPRYKMTSDGGAGSYDYRPPLMKEHKAEEISYMEDTADENFLPALADLEQLRGIELTESDSRALRAMVKDAIMNPWYYQVIDTVAQPDAEINGEAGLTVREDKITMAVETIMSLENQAVVMPDGEAIAIDEEMSHEEMLQAKDTLADYLLDELLGKENIEEEAA